jgi:hypothetical protein
MFSDALRRPARRPWSRPGSGKTRTRPRLELLEDRAVPTILFGDPVADFQIDSNKGRVMKSAKVELVFWGAGWNAASEKAVTDKITTLLGGHYMDDLGQYGGVGHAALDQTFTITSSKPAAKFIDTSVTAMLESNFQNGTLPVPSVVAGDALYVVIPQAGSVARGEGSGTLEGRQDTKTDAAYKDPKTHVSAPFDYSFAWTANPKDGNVDRITDIFSHELVEAVTDAGPGYQGYQFGSGGVDEIADGFPQQFGYRLDGVYVQPYWSQSDQSYVVPDGQSQNFLASVPVDVIKSYSGGGTPQHIDWKLVVKGDQLPSVDDTVTIDYDTTTGHDQVVATLNGETARFDRTYFPWDTAKAQAKHPTLKEIVINPLTGSNTINVEGNPDKVPVTVNGKGSNDALAVSPTAQNLDNIRAPITFNQNPTGNSITLFDQSAPGATTYSIKQGVVVRNGKTVVNFDDKTGSLTVNGVRVASATFNVDGTRKSAPITVNGFSGGDVFEVGPTEKKLDKLQGTLTLNGAAGAGNTLEVHDELNGKAAPSWQVSDSAVARLGAAQINYANMATLKVFGGSGSGGVYNVSSTAAGTATAITIK